MKARAVPVSFRSKNEEFEAQLRRVEILFGDLVELLPPVELGEEVPDSADAVLFPQLLGEAYQRLADFQRFSVPILVVTSEFGTISMWDWEIMEFLRRNRVKTLGPYDPEQTRLIFGSLAARARLRGGKFLMYQDNPGEGQQASIFKRFWWWEDTCRKAMKKRFGVDVELRSLKELGERIGDIDNDSADTEWRKRDIRTEGLTRTATCSAAKVYMEVSKDLDQDAAVIGVGMNCLNESHFLDTTPCVAWSMIFEERGLLWACEADIVSLATEYLVYESMKTPVMMTNVYPFLMGDAALKHEKIPSFPDYLDHPENHILVAHCGYFGLSPRPFSEEWTLRPYVLEIVEENSHVIDARWAPGPVSLVKLDSSFTKLMVTEGELKGYAQYPGSDCLNGGIIEIPDGPQFMKRLYSHHQIVVPGHQRRNLEIVAGAFGVEVESL